MSIGSRGALRAASFSGTSLGRDGPKRGHSGCRVRSPHAVAILYPEPHEKTRRQSRQFTVLLEHRSPRKTGSTFPHDALESSHDKGELECLIARGRLMLPDRACLSGGPEVARLAWGRSLSAFSPSKSPSASWSSWRPSEQRSALVNCP